MATPLKIMSAVLVDANVTLTQPREEATDAQAFDYIDMNVAIHHDGTNKPTINFYTSMQNQFDDLGKSSTSWVKIGAIVSPAVGYKTYTIPDTTNFAGTVLGRWIRWEVIAAASGNGCMVDVNGMGRRKAG